MLCYHVMGLLMLFHNKLIFFKILVYIYSILNISHYDLYMGFPDGSSSKESSRNAGDTGLIPGLGRSPGEGNGNPLQYYCLENSVNRGTWRATVLGVTKSRT